MKQIYVLFICLVSFLSAFAGGENLVAGANHSATGGTNVTAQNVFSAHNNPAGIAFVKTVGFGLYTDLPYIVKGINNFNLSAVVPVQKFGSFGVDINYFGYSAYNEVKAGISYARNFGDIVSAGIKFDYLKINIADNGSKNLFAFGIGLQYQAFKVLRIGANVYNPISMDVDNTAKEKLATNFSLGLAYIPSKKLTITLDGEKEIDQEVNFKAGIEYRPMKPLFLRVGAATNPTLITFGLGTEFKNFKIDASASWHLQLGITPQISLVYNFKKKDKEKSETE